MIKTIPSMLALLFAAPLAMGQGLTVGAVERVAEIPNPSFHNSAIGAAEVSNGGTTTYHTTTGDKQLAIGPAVVKRVVNATGTNVTVTFYDDADGTCDSGQKSGAIPLANSTPVELGFEFSAGACMTIGGTSPTLNVVTLP